MSTAARDCHPVPEINECKAFARQNGMFVVERGAELLLYRRAPGHNVRLGKRSTVAALRKLAAHCAHVPS